MKTVEASTQITVPKGTKVTIKSRQVTVEAKGKKLVKDFKHLPVTIGMEKNGYTIRVTLFFGLSKQKAALRTVASHIQNMITGVNAGFRYKLRLVYAHFPINAAIENKGKTLAIKNFLGEKVVRNIDMLGDTICKTTSTKDEIEITGSDIDATSRSAALVHMMCLVKKKDIRSPKKESSVYQESHKRLAVAVMPPFNRRWSCQNSR